jgi:hypothetical protein
VHMRRSDCTASLINSLLIIIYFLTFYTVGNSNIYWSSKFSILVYRISKLLEVKIGKVETQYFLKTRMKYY